MKQFEWNRRPPLKDGDFFYEGPTPDGTDVVAIVGITTIEGKRFAYLFIPKGWRGDETRQPTLHSAPIDEWTGHWAGPEHGLCCTTHHEND